MPDSYDKFNNLEIKYHMLSQIMYELKTRQERLEEYSPGAYSPIAAADYYLNKSEFFRKKRESHRSQEQIEEDEEFMRSLDELIETVDTRTQLQDAQALGHV